MFITVTDFDIKFILFHWIIYFKFIKKVNDSYALNTYFSFFYSAVNLPQRRGRKPDFNP